MQDIQLVLNVAVMFFMRIGIPLLVLILLGTLIDRWQTAREDELRRRYEADHQDEIGRNYEVNMQPTRQDEVTPLYDVDDMQTSTSPS